MISVVASVIGTGARGGVKGGKATEGKRKVKIRRKEGNKGIDKKDAGK
jgi:hypothetical protein